MSDVNRLSFETIREAMGSDQSIRTHFFTSPEGIVMFTGRGELMRRFLRPASPYLIEDYRMGIICGGEIRGRMNLVDYHASRGYCTFITPGTIIEPLEVSGDFILCGIGMSSDVFHAINHYHIPETFNGQMKFGIMQMPGADVEYTGRLFDMLGQVLRHESGSRDTRYAMVSALANHYNDMFASQTVPGHGRRDAASDIFDRFIYLVNKNAREQHQLDFYADKMCITSRYLGTVVRQVSGITAKEWIDRAIVTAAKVMLRHSNRQIVQISDELRFPNPSFFCKYFKRIVGCTPQEYREQ